MRDKIVQNTGSDRKFMYNGQLYICDEYLSNNQLIRSLRDIGYRDDTIMEILTTIRVVFKVSE